MYISCFTQLGNSRDTRECACGLYGVCVCVCVCVRVHVVYGWVWGCVWGCVGMGVGVFGCVGMCGFGVGIECEPFSCLVWGLGSCSGLPEDPELVRGAAGLPEQLLDLADRGLDAEVARLRLLSHGLLLHGVPREAGAAPGRVAGRVPDEAPRERRDGLVHNENHTTTNNHIDNTNNTNN